MKVVLQTRCKNCGRSLVSRDGGNRWTHSGGEWMCPPIGTHAEPDERIGVYGGS